jgi:hypothetical protein
MRAGPLKTLNLILSLSKDEAKNSYFFSALLAKSVKAGLDPALIVDG